MVRSVEELAAGAGPLAPYALAPTAELLEQQGDEWLCPLCLAEDTHGAADATPATRPIAVDEWGPSAALPWVLHPRLSTYHEQVYAQSPATRRLLQVRPI